MLSETCQGWYFYFITVFLFSPKDIFVSLLDREMRERHWLVAFLYMPWRRIEPATWVCALTGNQAHDLSFQATVLQPTELHPPGRQGCVWTYTTSMVCKSSYHRRVLIFCIWEHSLTGVWGGKMFGWVCANHFYKRFIGPYLTTLFLRMAILNSAEEQKHQNGP